MLKYQLAAGALKAFSLNRFTKQSYRMMGNLLGGKSRKSGIKTGYLERADENLAFIERNGAIRDGMRLLELGTGWVHWESLFTRLFYDVEIIAFDVWDNRQFDGFMTHARTLRSNLSICVHRDKNRYERAKEILDNVVRCGSFEEVYKLLDFQYLVKESGSLKDVAADSIDLIFSSDVMEHVPASSLSGLASDFRRVLRGGGHVSQQIVEADHLCIYDRSVHPKNYLRYSELAWKLRFENGVQYVNRWQHSDFLRLFADQGFDVVDQQIVSSADTTTIEIASRWHNYDREDLDATVTRLLVTPNKDL